MYASTWPEHASDYSGYETTPEEDNVTTDSDSDLGIDPLPCDIVRRWRLTFAGEQNEDAEEFFSRLSTMREICNLEDADLIRCLPICLTGTAALWYRSRPKMTTWEEFVRQWHVFFRDPDYQYHLEHDLRVRKQGPDEPVRDYFVSMYTMISRLEEPWPESKQIKTIYWGARAELRNAIPLTFVSTVSKLRGELIYAEREFLRSRCYTQQPRGLGREKSYRPPQYESANAVTEEEWEERAEARYRAGPSRSREAPAAEQPSPSQRRRRRRRRRVAKPNCSRGNSSRDSPSDPETSRADRPTDRQPAANSSCWNCQRIGHRSRNCPEAPRIHCFRCGEPGVTKNKCRRCAQRTGYFKGSRSEEPESHNP